MSHNPSQTRPEQTSPSSSSSPSFPSHLLSPSPPLPLPAADAAEVDQRMEAVQAELSALSPSLHSQFLLTQLHSAFAAQLESQRESQQWQAVAHQRQQRAAAMSAKCQQMQQRLSRLVDEAAALKGDLRSLQLELPGGSSADVNGTEEKQPNGHSHSRPPLSPVDAFPVPSLGAESAAATPTFSELSDFSTLLAATEAQLEVERRQRERTQTSSAASTAPTHFPSSLSLSTSTSSPYYHHDRSLTAVGKTVVRSIFLLFASSPSSSLSLPELQALSERVGRDGGGAESLGGEEDDSGDVWWVWQSHASEDEAGVMGMSEADLQGVYEQEWNLNDDARKLRISS